MYAFPLDSYQQENVVGNDNRDLLTIKREIGREGGKKEKEEREKGGRNEQNKRKL